MKIFIRKIILLSTSAVMMSLLTIALELEYDIFEESYLQYTEESFIIMHNPLSFRICIKECDKHSECLAINYDIVHLTCNLSSVTHQDDDASIVLHTGTAYVLLKSKSHTCNNCSTDETCSLQELSSGVGFCMKAGCIGDPPVVTNANMTRTLDPPMVTYTCVEGYNSHGTISTSTCSTDRRWSAIDFSCSSSGDKGWRSWSTYGSCSATCGGGIQQRSRSCRYSVTSNIERYCQGSSTSTQECNTEYCPVNGGWSEWTEGACTTYCSGGLQIKERTCTNPVPVHGGLPCNGDDTISVDCNQRPCPDYASVCPVSLYIGSEGTITSSSASASDHQLYGPSAWIPTSSSSYNWIQVFFSSKRYMTEIVTQGRYDANEWVERFQIYYFNSDTLIWKRTGPIYDANGDRSTAVKNTISPPLYEIGLRIEPRAWFLNPSLRFDIIGC